MTEAQINEIHRNRACGISELYRDDEDCDNDCKNCCNEGCECFYDYLYEDEEE